MEDSILELLSNDYNLTGYINEYVTHKLFDNAFVGLKNAVKRVNKKEDLISIEKFDKESTIEFIAKHLEENLKWASNISFRDMKGAKKLLDVFVELDLYVTPTSLKLEENEKVDTIQLSNLLEDTDKNIVLLGQPGAGKTTSTKRIFLELISKATENYTLYTFPIVIRLKELNYSQEGNHLPILNEVLNVLGVNCHFLKKISQRNQDNILIQVFKEFIERLNVLIIFDGYDEVSDMNFRNKIIEDLRNISHSLSSSKFILTSRSADYDIHIPNTSEYEIKPLDEEQINSFVRNWFSEPAKSEILLEKLKNSPYLDTAVRPLTIAHLCALFERANDIPSKPKSVYKKIVKLLLEEWSAQRSIMRPSKYANFEVDRKQDFLSRFAYQLCVIYKYNSFNEELMTLTYKMIHAEFNLPAEDASKVIREIESHNGLILKTGIDNYEFAHKSLQEYLAANYLCRLQYVISQKDIILSIPNEIAIWIAMSSDPDFALFKSISNILDGTSISNSFLRPFFTRLNIEKPDYIGSELLSIIVLIVYELISVEISMIEDNKEKSSIDDEFDYDKDEGDEEDINDAIIVSKKDSIEQASYISTLSELDKIVDLYAFKASIKKLKGRYTNSKVELKKRKYRYFAGLSKQSYLLSRQSDDLSVSGNIVQPPRQLLLTEKMFKIFFS